MQIFQDTWKTQANIKTETLKDTTGKRKEALAQEGDCEAQVLREPASLLQGVAHRCTGRRLLQLGSCLR